MKNKTRFRITKHNQKQPIPTVRLGKATLNAKVQRIDALTRRLAWLNSERAEVEKMFAEVQNFKTVWLYKQVSYISITNIASDIHRTKQALAEAQKELDQLAKDPIYAKHILLCKLRLE